METLAGSLRVLADTLDRLGIRYLIGGSVASSVRQWNDIGGIIATNPDLDRPYLQSWAAKLRVTDLLERALQQAQ
jgi:hypothetical protein